MPLITPSNEQQIYASILDKCQEMKCDVLALGGTSDHIHILVKIPSTITVADLVKQVKGASSHMVSHRIAVGEFFKWQGAYGAFTVSKSLILEVKAYIDHQKQHHADKEFRLDWEQTISED